MNNTQQSQIRMMVKGAYQMQRMRIQAGNRITGNFKIKLGQQPGMTEEALEEASKTILDDIRKDFKTITEGVAKFPKSKKFKGVGVIDTYTELCLVEEYIALEKAEDTQFKRIGEVLNGHPLWEKYLKHVKGVGPAMAGVIIAEIDISKAQYPSSLWKLAGLDVAWDGKGRSKRADHLIDVEYLDGQGNEKLKKSITFKPFLKTKLMGVLSGCFIKSGNGEFVTIYRDYKTRLENHPSHRNCFVGLNVDKCKKILGYIPKNIYRKQYVTDMYDMCETKIRSEMDVSSFTPEELKKEIRRFQKHYLGKFEIYEHLLRDGMVTEYRYTEDEIKTEVKNAGGILRKIKTVEIFDKDTETNAGLVKFIEDFDDTPDTKGRSVWKMVNIGKTKAHRNQMAVRYMMKRFLVELYKAWRSIEGLPVMEEYSIAKLGIVHGKVSEGKVK